MLRIESGGATREVVLRRWVRGDWRVTDPEFSPVQEAATYELLASSPVRAPRLLAADVEGRECDVPAILITRMPGTPPPVPTVARGLLTQLASALPLVHAVDPARASRLLPAYGPYNEPTNTRAPAWARRQTVWERAIDAVAAPPRTEAPAFIHRDYHPGNTLWAGGTLTAIVDWTPASWGPPSVDLAHMRANLAITSGLEAAAEFLDLYDAVAGRPADFDPYWDLRVAVDFIPDLPKEGPPIEEIDRLEAFVTRGLAEM